jgi:hypothetical protein
MGCEKERRENGAGKTSRQGRDFPGLVVGKSKAISYMMGQGKKGSAVATYDYDIGIIGGGE